MDRQAVTVGPGGRIVIPASMRQKLAIQPGETVWLEENEGEVRIISVCPRIREVQQRVAQYVPSDISLADELIAERRAEAARE